MHAPAALDQGNPGALLEAFQAALYEAAAEPAADGITHLIESCDAMARALGGRRGLPEVLRLLAAGLRQRRAIALDPTELLTLLDWASALDSYLDASAPATGSASLLDRLATLTWVPGIAPRLRQHLLQCLDGSSGTRPAPDASTGIGAGVIGPDPSALAGAQETETRDRSGLRAGTASKPAALPSRIGVALEELALLSGALRERLAVAIESVLSSDTESETTAREELAWQCELFGRALGLLGLDTHAEFYRQFASTAIGLDKDALTTLHALCACLAAALDAPADAQLWNAVEECAAFLCTSDDAAALADEGRRIDALAATRRERRREVDAEECTLTFASDVLPSVLEGMRRELPRRTAELSQALQALIAGDDSDALGAARRAAHTLKGDANTVGVRGLANLAHALEDLLDDLARAAVAPERALGELLVAAGDCIEASGEFVLGRAPAPTDVEPMLRALRGADVESGAVPEPQLHAATVPAPAEPAAAAVDAAQAVLSVPVALLDELVRLASESIVLKRQLDEQVRRIADAQREARLEHAAQRDLVARLDDQVAMRGAALQSARLRRGSNVDPLELDQYNELHMLSRRLAETATDQGELMRGVESALTAFDDLAAAQERTQSELQQLVLRTRTVPFEQIVPRLARVVRQTARDLGREAVLEVDGGATPIDAELLERVTEPLLHALRNAVDHGIEVPQQRIAATKPAAGKITLLVRRDRERIRLSLADDGRGIDYGAVRARAIERGLLASNAEAGEAELARLLFLPGFSTRGEVTQISGRGVGMDVVARRVAELRGTLALSSRFGQGTTLELSFPASLGSAHVAVVACGTQRVALVGSSFERFVNIEGDALQRRDEALIARVDGEDLPALWLESVTGFAPDPRARSTRPIAALARGRDGGRVAVLVHAVHEMREVVVKSFGKYVQPIAGVRGVTILGDGDIAPVLDLEPLLGATGTTAAPGADAELAASLPLALVVDDSLSVRRSLRQLLEDLGFEVREARDGVEAIDAMRERRPDIAFVDLEMPRMNGLELTQYLRNQNDTRKLPIVMISSRTADTHRRLAFEAGVDDMLGKPYRDDQVADLARRLLIQQR
jgi:chemotaxis protein histidine kinase CheA